MGNDGGVIAVKREFMAHGQMKKKEEQADPNAVREKRTTMCALTDEPLKEPIVADKLGNLFNKERLIERLLDRSLPEQFGYIRSLKDVVNVKFYEAPDTQPRDSKFRYHCPITRQRFNGLHAFVAMKKCGCVVSEKAIKEVKPKECLMCGFPVKEDEIWPLLLPADKATEVQATLRKSSKGTKRKHVKDAPEETLKKSKLHVVNQANEAVTKEKERNAVYASLFSTKDESKKSANELLMTVGGLRYTLS